MKKKRSKKDGRVTSGLVTLVKKGFAHCTSEIYADRYCLLVKLGSTMIANCYLPYYKTMETVPFYQNLLTTIAGHADKAACLRSVYLGDFNDNHHHLHNALENFQLEKGLSELSDNIDYTFIANNAQNSTSKIDHVLTNYQRRNLVSRIMNEITLLKDGHLPIHVEFDIPRQFLNEIKDTDEIQPHGKLPTIDWANTTETQLLCYENHLKKLLQTAIDDYRSSKQSPVLFMKKIEDCMSLATVINLPQKSKKTQEEQYSQLVRETTATQRLL